VATPTLQTYLYQTRQLLRDANSDFYTDTFLTLEINQARQNVIRDTLCTRALALISTVGGTEVYPFSLVLSNLQTQGLPAQQILTGLNVTLDWTTNLRISMDYYPWTKFNALFRAYPFQTIPTIWSMYAYQAFYVFPIPSQVYTLEIDCVYLPSDMVKTTDVEASLPFPWSDLVQFQAAYLAKQYEQAQQEAQTYFQRYQTELQLRRGANPPWRIRSQYGNRPY
jgi:hypothetical protein